MVLMVVQKNSVKIATCVKWLWKTRLYASGLEGSIGKAQLVQLQVGALLAVARKWLQSSPKTSSRLDRPTSSAGLCYLHLDLDLDLDLDLEQRHGWEHMCHQF